MAKSLLLDSWPFMAWLKDRNGKYVTVNRNFADFYSMKSTEIIGKTDFDKIALEHRNIEEEVIRTESKQSLNRIHVKNEASDEWFEILILPFFEDSVVIGTKGVANNITEQVQLEMELTNQKRFLKTMLDTIPDYIFYKDLNSAFLGCNKNAEKVLGVNEDEIIGKTDLDLIKDIDLARFYRQKDQEVFMAGKTLKNEEIIILTDGSVIDAETVRMPILDEHGNVAGLIGIARDIAERKRLEKQLRKEAEYAKLLFSTVPSAVFSVDKFGKIIRWNKIAEEITGYAVAEVMGKECSKVLHGICRDDCGLCGKAIDSTLINEKCKIITKDGQIRHVLKSIAVLKDEFGEITEKMECFEDITEMTDMEAELLESKERYGAIVNNAPLFVVIHKKGVIKYANTINEIFLITDQENIVYVSPAYERICGMSCQSLLDNRHSLVELIHPADRKKMRVSFPQSFLNMNEATSKEFRIIRPDGEIRWLWLQSYPLRDEANNIPLKASSVVDITDRKNMEGK
ncbi:MAG: hypothetical protein APF81_11990 [Desulfosporosinus sp. BRH_c37]|nr:MAG: hypothetical protein APF81_11990 [Desulfosporosinus sp. BRH_c37]